MGTYAAYFLKEKGNYVHPLGDRSVLVLDSRKTLDNLYKDVLEENGHHRPVYDAFAIFRGPSLAYELKPITKLICLSTGKVIRKVTKEDF